MRLRAAANGAGANALPIGAGEFAAAMAPLGPWEPRPRLAVAVSGGADSRALALLAASWTQAQGGSLRALVVDHGLRPQSAAEAQDTLHWLEAQRIPGLVLQEPDAAPPPGTRIQERARALRYRLLVRQCLQEGIPHLLIAHHREDQIETVLLRLSHGSGLRGLAGMSGSTLAVGSCGRLRLLRPVLDFPKARLRASLEAAGQGWIEDPSNRDLRFERVRLRQLLPLLAAGGLDPRRIAESTGRMAAERIALSRSVAAWFARAARVSPFGHLELDLSAYGDQSPALAEEGIRRIIAAVGGGEYPPRLERLRRLATELRSGPTRLGRSLGGCLLRRQGMRLTVTREAAAIGPPAPARPGLLHWDGRFELHVEAPAAALEAVMVDALGAEGLAELRGRLAQVGRRLPEAPASQLASLPGFWREGRLLTVPGHGFAGLFASSLPATVAWAPRQPLTA